MAPSAATITMTIEPLARADLAEARALLAAACRFDRAAEVADEKLFGAAPAGDAATWAARAGGAMVGIAAVTGDRLRLLAVAPEARGRGVGGRLLEQARAHAGASGEVRLRTLDLAGNYLAPGVDARDVDSLRWLERRGFVRKVVHENLLIDLRGNPRVGADHAAALAAAATARGYQLRRARADEPGLTDAIAAGFGGAWPFEVARALTFSPPGVHVAIAADGTLAAFAAHDGNNQGLGWFGPAGTWPAHRGQGLGEALLAACLVDVAAHHDVCEVAWIGPRAFYEKAAGIAGERRFIVLAKDLRQP
ncbi:MAG: GNAT family N-acetyltransferase [Kofleriaceae bacterium]|nr:GNAT family N-acetyltransferase [Kofleriaceae bacterium]